MVGVAKIWHCWNTKDAQAQNINFESQFFDWIQAEFQNCSHILAANNITSLIESSWKPATLQFMQFQKIYLNPGSICKLNIIIVCINLMLQTFNCIFKFAGKKKRKTWQGNKNVKRNVYIECHSPFAFIFVFVFSDQLFWIICWIYNWFNFKVSKKKGFLLKYFHVIV